MTDGILCEAIRAALQPTFSGIYIGMPQDDAPIPMPAIILELQSDVVVGSPLQRGSLSVSVCSQADDTTPHAHSVFSAAVDQAVRSMHFTGGAVQLYGVVCMSTDLRRAERHWQTFIKYVLGFGPTS